MIVCEKCFSDAELVSIIRSKECIGNCPICNHRNVYIYDTDKYDELTVLLDDFVSIYTPVSMLPSTFPKDKTQLLKNELINNWHIFSSENESVVYRIISSVLKDKYESESELFDYPVGIKELYDFEYLSGHSLLKTNSWDGFVEALKNRNRFHTHYLDLKLLERFFSYIRKPYKAGTIFYRSRLSTKAGLTCDEMGAPRSEKAPDGRANACGIRCLYLGNEEETTIYEVRAGLYDYVTVGKFVLKRDVIVVDFKQINLISPFLEGLDCMEYAINKEHLNKISNEMSKVMRRSDSILDYIPTQYITDFVKSIKHDGVTEYAGIEYKSVMYNKGYNMAVFDPELFECVETKVYRIDTMDYDRSRVL